MTDTAKKIRDHVVRMEQSPSFYTNITAGVLFVVETQSRLPHVLRLIRRDLRETEDTAEAMFSGQVGVDTYESFAINYHLPVPLLVASFGHRLRQLSDDSVIDIPSGRSRVLDRAGFIVRSTFLHLRSGIMSVSPAEQQNLLDQLEGAQVRSAA